MFKRNWRILLGSVLLSVGLHSFAATPTPKSPTININHANAAELTQLPGIGPNKAKAIIAYRKQHGDFKSVSELSHVKGIGPKILEKDKALLQIK
ncbi:ComEA family DNA-binding protein [Celerinatantimonas sp. YJH-8]|uniref:ComEA family DNA-binding protein n=1 Tax=Celerinatantimonas sp. YJH-8 TaxID=3228714 RepID=UPI0038BFDEA1